MMKRQALAVAGTSALLLTVLVVSAVSQQAKRIDVGKTGKFHIDSPLLIGGTLLKSGMYKLEHVSAGGKCLIVVRTVKMNRYGRSMGSQKIGEEIARVNCVVEPTDLPNKDAKILARTIPARKREAVQVWLRYEKARYVLQPAAKNR